MTFAGVLYIYCDHHPSASANEYCEQLAITGGNCKLRGESMKFIVLSIERICISHLSHFIGTGFFVYCYFLYSFATR